MNRPSAHHIRTIPELVRALRLRTEVFVVEQRVPPEEELDVHDETAYHVLVSRGQEALGTGRLLFVDGRWKIGRMAVRSDARKSGVGRALVEALEEEAVRRGAGEIHLSAQTTAAGFYERLGYRGYGEVFLDANIEHRMMKKVLSM